jgi:hypothetical protein
MSGRRRQGILFLLLSLGLSTFFVVHSLLVDVDFEACFENYAASVSGYRPRHLVSEMSLGELVRSVSQAASVDDLILAGVGLLPLTPFLAAWAASRGPQAQRFWTASAIVSATLIVAWTSTRRLRDFYDCDLNGVTVAILVAPIMYAALNLIVMPFLGAFRYVFLAFTGRT